MIARSVRYLGILGAVLALTLAPAHEAAASEGALLMRALESATGRAVLRTARGTEASRWTIEEIERVLNRSVQGDDLAQVLGRLNASDRRAIEELAAVRRYRENIDRMEERLRAAGLLNGAALSATAERRILRWVDELFPAERRFFTAAAAEGTVQDAQQALLAAGQASSHLDEFRILRDKTNIWRLLFGQDVDAPELILQSRIVKLDHFLSLGDADAAANLILKARMRSLTGKVRDVESVFLDAESAALEIRNLEDTLSVLQSEARITRSTRFNGEIARVTSELERQKKIFGDAFPEYYRLRSHLQMVMESSTCGTVCSATAAKLIGRIGVNDALFKSTFWRVRAESLGRLRSLGIRDRDIPSRLLRNSAEGTFDRELLRIDALVMASRDPGVMRQILKNARGRQIAHSLRLMFAEPVVSKVVYRTLSMLPVLRPIMRNAEVTKVIFRRLTDAYAANNHFYPITMLLRSDASTAVKLVDLYNLGVRDKTLLETFVRRSDTGSLRKALLDEAGKAEYAGIYDDIKRALSDETTAAVKQRLGELSPLYSISPWEHVSELAATAAVAYAAAKGYDLVDHQFFSDNPEIQQAVQNQLSGPASEDVRVALDEVLYQNPELKRELLRNARLLGL